MKTPEIFVKRDEPDGNGRWLARARLRVKDGEVFLCWMEGRKNKQFYLGRRDRSFAPPSNRYRQSKSVEGISSGFLFAASEAQETKHT
jgi:hypothetical protein